MNKPMTKTQLIAALAEAMEAAFNAEQRAAEAAWGAIRAEVTARVAESADTPTDNASDADDPDEPVEPAKTVA